MNEQWGLTADGFHRPSYTELLDAFEIKAKELFGSTINLTVRSPLGLFLRIFAWFAGLAWQLAEDVYNSGFVDTAAGVSLARLGAVIGIRPLSAQKATGLLKITGDPGAVVHAGFLVQARNRQRFVTLDDVTLNADGTASVLIQAYEAGPDGNVGTGSIDTVVTPVSAVISVTNPMPATGGRARETDQEFRERYAKSVNKPGGSNPDAIRAQLLIVPGVITAEVWENETDAVDEEGLPPHSIEAIVYGGLDADVAEAVFLRKAGGIQTSGDTSVQLLDAAGRMKTVRFSRPGVISVYVRIRSLVTSEAYSGDNTLREALLRYIGSESEALSGSGLSIGETVYYNRLMAPLNAVPGVVDYSLEICTDGSSWAKENIPVSARSKAVTSSEKVVIER